MATDGCRSEVCWDVCARDRVNLQLSPTYWMSRPGSMMTRPVRASASPLTIADRRRLNAARLESRRAFNNKRLQARYLIAIGGAWPFIDSVRRSVLWCTHRIFHSLPPVSKTVALLRGLVAFIPLERVRRNTFYRRIPIGGRRMKKWKRAKH